MYIKKMAKYLDNGATKPQPSAEGIEAPKRLQLKEEPKADVARYDVLLKKLAMAAIAAMPILMAVAKFPECRELANLDSAESPVNEQQMRTLHEGAFTEEKRNQSARTDRRSKERAFTSNLKTASGPAQFYLTIALCSV